MSTETRKRIVKVAAFVVGLTFAALALAGWRVPAGRGDFGTDVRVAAKPAGELNASAAGAFLEAKGLRPGGPAARGSVELTNISPKQLAFRTRATTSIDDIDDVLQIQISAGGATVYSGTLAGLKQWTASTFMIGSGLGAKLDVTVSLPAGSDKQASDGRIADIDLEFEADAKDAT